MRNEWCASSFSWTTFSVFSLFLFLRLSLLGIWMVTLFSQFWIFGLVRTPLLMRSHRGFTFFQFIVGVHLIFSHRTGNRSVAFWFNMNFWFRNCSPFLIIIKIIFPSSFFSRSVCMCDTLCAFSSTFCPMVWLMLKFKVILFKGFTFHRSQQSFLF